MSDLKSMLKLQARLHKKQGAESLGLLFDSALSEIETLEVRAEALQRELENERMMSMKRFVETGRADTFAIQQQIKVLEDLLGRVCPISGEVIPDNLSRDAIHDEINQLRQQLNGGK